MRRDFPKSVKRLALQRSGKRCEAIGPLYGLEEGQRCNADLSKGIHFDHVNGDSAGGEPTLENCAATCPMCNMKKNNIYDTPRAAKIKRVSDKHLGIVKTKKPWPKRGEWKDNTKYIERFD